MKKDIRTLAALLIASATFVACSSDDDSIIENQQPVNPTVKYTMTINASKGDDATTRALDLNDHTLNATWDEGEIVEVYQNNSKIGELTAASSTNASTKLSGTLTSAPNASQDLTFYFHTAAAPSYSGQDGTLTKIASTYDFCEPATVTTGNFTVNTSEQTVNVPSGITFGTNQQAIVKFKLKNGDGTTTLSATELIVNDGTNAYIVTPASGTDVIYVAIPGFSDKTVTLTATDGGNNIYTYQKSGVTFTNGKYYEISVKMTPDTRKDLSMVDCAGIARASMWTANCYMVHTAGYYQLPLVYGNAIKNGEDNTVAYTGVSGNSNATATFPNHAGNAIDAPWITKSTSGAGVNKGKGITVASAELLWQDAQGLITKVGISGDYLTLTVGKNATTQEGNALVAAKDASGNIVWSWHIWVTNQTFATADLKDFAAEIKNGNNTTSYTYKVTPVNLGWVGEATSTTGYCTYYQWGRKDAFIPSTGNANTNHTVYDISGATVTGISHSTEVIGIDGNIKNPTVFYKVEFYKEDQTTYYGPCNTQYYNMWDAQRTSTTVTATATVKTVYDPCPPGFCVPTDGLSQANDTWTANYTYNNVFSPASGYRGFSSGNLENVGSSRCYWSVTPGEGGTLSRYFDIGSSGWGLNYNYRSYGYPVRAVAE